MLACVCLYDAVQTLKAALGRASGIPAAARGGLTVQTLFTTTPEVNRACSGFCCRMCDLSNPFMEGIGELLRRPL